MFDFNDIEKLSSHDLNELSIKINNIQRKQRLEEEIKEIKSHESYIGKCYKEKDKDKYIRVISANSSNEYRLDCLCFELPVSSDTNNQGTMRYTTFFETIDFNGFYVEDYPYFCNIFGKGELRYNLEEISEEEYFKKFDEYANELKNMLINNKFYIPPKER